ncbi:MAG: Atxe2 family lasso peptide isopeptidase [Amphiplicatus sp.]
MLVEITDFTGLSISPDGDYAAYRAERASVEENAYRSEWFVFRLDGDEAPRRIADGGAPIFTGGWAMGEAPRWSPDSKWFYFRALQDGEVQIWRASMTGTAERVTDHAADIESFELLAGDNLAYEIGASRAQIEQAELDEYHSGILIDGSVPIGQGLFRSGLHNGRRVTQRYLGEWMQVTTLLGDRPTQVKIMELESGRVRSASQQEEKAFRRIAGGPSLDGAPGRSERTHVTADGRAAYAIKEEGKRLLRARIGEREFVCAAPQCSRSIAWLSWRGAAREVVFATRDRERGDAMSIFAWDVENDGVRLVREAQGLLHSGRVIGLGAGCAVNAHYALCIAADANTPPQIERIDLDSGESRVIAAPNRALARNLDAHAELLSWRDGEGRVFTGYFYPAARDSQGETASPLFLTYYNCQGFIRGGFGDEWPLVSLASAGIASLCINMYPMDGAAVSAIEEYEIALAGINSAIDLVESRGVDRERIGMGGFSFGASVAMWTAYHSDLIAAASLATPTMTASYYWQRALKGDAFKENLKRVWGLGAPDETPEQWRRISPSRNLTRLRFPLLMQLAEQEYLVAPEYFVPLMESGAPVEVHVFPDAPHYKIQPRRRLAIYQRNLDWFRFWLLGEEAADARAAQFERWRKLKEGAQSSDIRSEGDANGQTSKD